MQRVLFIHVYGLPKSYLLTLLTFGLLLLFQMGETLKLKVHFLQNVILQLLTDLQKVVTAFNLSKYSES